MPRELLSPDWDRIVVRFHELTDRVLSPEQRARALAAVAELDERPDCRAIVECLR
jgi:hypothetical protein